MTIFPQPEYIRLLKMVPEKVCVERGVQICRSFLSNKVTPELADSLPESPPFSNDDLNLRGALLGTAQGIRIHAAMMNMNIPEEGEIQIVDWNAEQGFHTMAMIEVLIARGIHERLKRVTLIHPCENSLLRARCGVALMTDDCSIDTLKRNLPAQNGTLPLGIHYYHDIIIHIIPDALNLPGIDLKLWAYLISDPAHFHIIVSVNELTDAADNAPELASLLGITTPDVDISSPCFTFTPQGFPVSLRAYAWHCAPEKRLEMPDNEEFTSGLKPLPGADIRWNEQVKKYSLPPSILDFIIDIRRLSSNGDHLIFHPSLPPYHASLAIIRPDRGMMLCSIILSTPAQNQFITDVEHAVQNLRDMRRLLALSLPGIDGRKKVREHIRLAVLTANCSTEDLPELPLPGNAILLAPDFLHTENGKRLYHTHIPLLGSYIFTDEIALKVRSLLFPEWHWAINSKLIIPDHIQEKSLDAAYRWVIGGASTGKTTALLLKAASRFQATGKPVLVILPQASALCHTRNMLRNTFADIPLSAIHLLAYSDLQRAHGLVISYHTILIDDAHLLTPFQLTRIRDSYLHPEGSITAYSNPLLSRQPISMTGSVLTLTKNYSPSAASIGPLISRLALNINPDLPKLPTSYDKTKVKHLRIDKTDSTEIGIILQKHISDNLFYDKETLIVADDLPLMQDLHQFLTQDLGYNATTTFATLAHQAEYARTTKNLRGALQLQDDSEQHRFDPDFLGLKLALTHQLPSLQIPNVIYLYRRTARPDYRHLYQVASRATSTLSILTLLY